LCGFQRLRKAAFDLRQDGSHLVLVNTALYSDFWNKALFVCLFIFAAFGKEAAVLEYLIHTSVKGIDLTFLTDEKCFSPRHIDFGTLAMLIHAELEQGKKVLDLGCGYGAVGIVCAKFTGAENVVLSDMDENALSLARENAQRNGVPGVRILHSDGLDAIPDHDFDLILCNPPYHTDFSVAKRFIEGGYRRLKTGGKLLMVTKRREWYKRKFIAVFGGVTIFEHDGYFVFLGVKFENIFSNSEFCPPCTDKTPHFSKKPNKEYAKMENHPD